MGWKKFKPQQHQEEEEQYENEECFCGNEDYGKLEDNKGCRMWNCRILVSYFVNRLYTKVLIKILQNLLFQSLPFVLLKIYY